MSETRLQLAKQNFKFSAAHFLIFSDTEAERLHGHNYQVRVEIGVSDENFLKSQGFFVDFNVFKKYIKSQMDLWDERVLLPQQQKDMKFTINGDSLEVRFRERFYVFPKNEVVLLPVNNTSVENFSRLLAENFLQEFRQHRVTFVSVSVEESPGQGAITEVTAAPAPAR